MQYREITEADIPALFEVRVRTHENALTLEELESFDITEDSVRARMEGTFKGWLAETGDRVVGFAMGDRSTGELWVIAVLPEFVGQGIGGVLLDKVEDWLRASGCRRLWLTTDEDTSLKAYGFYLHRGWKDDRIDERGNRFMCKEFPE